METLLLLLYSFIMNGHRAYIDTVTDEQQKNKMVVHTIISLDSLLLHIYQTEPLWFFSNSNINHQADHEDLFLSFLFTPAFKVLEI